MNRKIALAVRDSHCTLCKMSDGADDVCVTAVGPRRADIMVVSKSPNSERYQAALEHDLAGVGIEPSEVIFTAALKCRNFEVKDGRNDLKACKVYLDREIAIVKPKWILALGNEALASTTGHSGIMTYRGRVIDRGDHAVFPTISPASVLRNPGQRSGYEGDLQLFAAKVFERAASIPTPKIVTLKAAKDVYRLRDMLYDAAVISYDIETWSPGHVGEHHPEAVMLTLAITIESKRGDVVTAAVPLGHPQSPFRSQWQRLLEIIAPAMCQVPKRIAHNGKYDDRWLQQFGVDIDETFDTMLAAHLLDENRLKALKSLGTMLLGVEQWGIDTKDMRQDPITKVLHYNSLDAYHTYHIYLDLRKQLIQLPRVLRIFKLIMMPASKRLTRVERRGIWMDREKLATNKKIAFDMRDEIDLQLQQHVPTGMLEELTGLGWPTQGKRLKLAEVNFNASNWLRWWLFGHLGLPIVELTDSGMASVREAVMLELRGKHPAVDLLLERSKWQKYCSSFLTTYEEMLDENDRVHSTFKLYGTVTGRLSSGKADADKVASRANIRGVNLQQVPRDPFIRGLFGAAPGYTFVEADFSQVELRIVAFLSRDRTMLHLYQTGQDIHRATASWVLGVPESEITKDDRKKAKAVNFGFVYGMYPKKFVATAFEKYELHFSMEEAAAIRKSFFQQFTGLLPWHEKQRRLVQEYRRVQSPIGRIRHLPDIDSPDRGVRMEAERQAINSPVQSFGSDMTMLSMILIQQQFEKHKIDGYFISTVHDALLFEIRHDHVARALPIIKRTMENLPLEKKFGVVLDVPIIADIMVGKYWGESRELTAEEVFNYAA